LLQILAEGIGKIGQGKSNGSVVWPPYPPAAGEEWVQIEPYVWHFATMGDGTGSKDMWYTMGREGLQWQLDHLVSPKIKELQAKLGTDPENANVRKALEYYQNRSLRMSSARDKAGSYYDHPNPSSLPEQPEACNYAVTDTYITSQIYGSGTACASGASADTWVEIHITRGINPAPEVVYRSGTTWASMGVTRAKIPDYGCDVDAWSHAFWGPFWWDSQDSYNGSSDYDCR
jgi:hypothetical protein